MLSAILSMVSDETDKELVRSLYENNEQLMYNIAYNILHNRNISICGMDCYFTRSKTLEERII